MSVLSDPPSPPSAQLLPESNRAEVFKKWVEDCFLFQEQYEVLMGIHRAIIRQFELTSSAPAELEGELKRIAKEVCTAMRFSLRAGFVTGTPVPEVVQTCENLAAITAFLDEDGKIDYLPLLRLTSALLCFMGANPISHMAVGPKLRRYLQLESIKHFLSFFDREHELNANHPTLEMLDETIIRLERCEPVLLDVEQLLRVRSLCRAVISMDIGIGIMSAYCCYYWLSGVWPKF